MGKSSAPPPPNYAELIPLQERSNLNQFYAMLNASRPNTITPFGTQTWYRPGTYPSSPGAQIPPIKHPNPPVVVPASSSGQVKATTSQYEMGEGWDIHPRRVIPEDVPVASVPASAGTDYRSVYDEEAAKGPWTLVLELSPEQQRLYEQDLRIRQAQGDIGEGMLGNIRSIYSQPAEFASHLPGFERIQAPTYTGKGATDLVWMGPTYRTALDSREAVERSLYNKAMRYVEPQLQREEEALHNRLIAQGFNVGDPAYQRAMDEFAQRRERVYADARDAAIIGGGREATEELQRGLAAEQARYGAGVTRESLDARLAQALFGSQLAGAQFSARERDAALQNALQRIALQQQDRARLLNELNAFRTGQQVQLPNLPAQFSTPNLQGIDLLGIARGGYQDQLNISNAELAAESELLSGLMSLVGLYFGGPLGAAAAGAATRAATSGSGRT